VTTLFTRATAAGDPAGNVHIIPLNRHVSPTNITYYVTQAVGTGEVSAATYFTISNIYDTAISPIWFLLDSIVGAQTTVQSNLVPMTAFQFSVNVSGSANYAAGLFQPGM